MFNGVVNFVAKVTGNGVKFPLFDFNPNRPGVARIEVEALNGDELNSAVHLSFVATHNDGRAVAVGVNRAALDRIAFFRDLVIENARITGEQFSAVTPRSGVFAVTAGSYLLLGGSANFVHNVSSQQLKQELEQPNVPGERNFGLLCSARRSGSPVEEFMHLYNILLMLFNDRQDDLDSFIVTEDSAVPQTPSPRVSGRTETVYTRLRNELAHQRAGVVIDQTKAEMAQVLGDLIALTKRAIELKP